MKNQWQDDCIHFEYNNQIIICRITDNKSPIRRIRGEEKMSRYANFYDSDNTPIVTGWAIYGPVEEMINITPTMAEKWYKEYLKRNK